MTPISSLRVACVPATPDLTHPMDRRRIGRYAALRGLRLEVARPGERYDLVFVSSLGDLAYWAGVPRSTRVVYDLCDGYLEDEGLDPRALLRGLAKRALGQVSGPVRSFQATVRALCERADAMQCSSPEQAARIREHNPNVHPIPDFHSELGGRAKHVYEGKGPLSIAWEGMAGNLRTFDVVAEVLRDVARSRGLVLHLVTDPRYKPFNGPVPKLSTERLVARHLRGLRACIYPWQDRTMPAIVAACDLAIVPIPRRPAIYWMKPENKLLVFWRLGVPTLVSATPAYARVAKDAGTPEVACHTPEEWATMLGRWASDPGARQAAAEAGLRYVERTTSDVALLERWDAMPRSIDVEPSA